MSSFPIALILFHCRISSYFVFFLKRQYFKRKKSSWGLFGDMSLLCFRRFLHTSERQWRHRFSPSPKYIYFIPVSTALHQRKTLYLYIYRYIYRRFEEYTSMGKTRKESVGPTDNKPWKSPFNEKSSFSIPSGSFRLYSSYCVWLLNLDLFKINSKKKKKKKVVEEPQRASIFGQARPAESLSRWFFCRPFQKFVSTSESFWKTWKVSNRQVDRVFWTIFCVCVCVRARSIGVFTSTGWPPYIMILTEKRKSLSDALTCRRRPASSFMFSYWRIEGGRGPGVCVCNFWCVGTRPWSSQVKPTHFRHNKKGPASSRTTFDLYKLGKKESNNKTMCRIIKIRERKKKVSFLCKRETKYQRKCIYTWCIHSRGTRPVV